MYQHKWKWMHEHTCMLQFFCPEIIMVFKRNDFFKKWIKTWKLSEIWTIVVGEKGFMYVFMLLYYYAKAQKNLNAIPCSLFGLLNELNLLVVNFNEVKRSRNINSLLDTMILQGQSNKFL